MIVFWLSDPPLFIHRIANGSRFDGPRFATVDEGDERTIISTQGGVGSFGPYAHISMGPFELDLLGVMALVSEALCKARIPMFAISTYRYDHILVPMESSSAAIDALLNAGLSLKG